jgi:TRAP-type C4-dicarboxylate transport system substrate-binding protein
MSRCLFAVFLVLLGVLLLPAPRSVATEGVELRLATLAPPGSTWERVFRAFGNSLTERTQGRIKTRIYAGGVAGDERDINRKMKVGQLEGAALTSIGLGQIVRSVLVLQLPGLFENPAQLAKVRAEMSKELEEQFLASGYVFLGWGDVGDRRVFSTKPILSPKDYLTSRPWVWTDDPISAELMSIIGANGVRIGLPEVFPALQTGMVDTVTASATSAVALQWFRYVKYMSKSTGEPVIGATVVSKTWFDALPPDLKEAVLETSKKAHEALNARIATEDANAANTLRQRGIQEFDMMAHRAEWEPVLYKLASNLTGKLYSRALLERTWKIARGSEVPAAIAAK